MIFNNSVCKSIDEFNKDILINKIEKLILNTIEKQGYVRECDILQLHELNDILGELVVKRTVKKIIIKNNLVRMKMCVCNKYFKNKISSMYLITRKTIEEYNKKIA